MERTAQVVVTEAARGPRGYSAYQVAVQEGFAGTEAEWLDSLQGMPPDGDYGDIVIASPGGAKTISIDPTVLSVFGRSLAGTINSSAARALLSLHFYAPEDYGAVGDGAVNDTDAFEAMTADVQAASGGVILLDPKAVYRVGKQTLTNNGAVMYSAKDVIYLTGCTKPIIILGQGAKFQLAPGLRFGTFNAAGVRTDHAMPYTGGDACSLVGHNGIIALENNTGGIHIDRVELDGNIGAQLIGGQFGDTGYQLQADGLYLGNNKGGVRVVDVYSHHNGRDGFLVAAVDNANPNGPDIPRVPHEFINCHADLNCRNNVSDLGGKGIIWRQLVSTNAGQTSMGLPIASAPSSCYDLETEWGSCRQRLFEDCDFINGAGATFVSDHQDVADLFFNRCRFDGPTNVAAWLEAIPGVVMRDCTIFGVLLYEDPADLSRAGQFYNCHFTDKDGDSVSGSNFVPFLGFALFNGAGGGLHGNKALLNHCTFDSHHAVPISATGPILQDCAIISTGGLGGVVNGVFRGINTITAPLSDIYNLPGYVLQGSITLNGVVYATWNIPNITVGGIVASGNITAANLSGTNTGDQIITLTGDVTGSGGGTFAASISAPTVVAKIAGQAIAPGNVVSSGIISQAAPAGAAGYLNTNAANRADTVALNPGLAVFNDGTNTYGVDLGYTRGTFVTRIFAPSSREISLGGRAANAAGQADFTEWAYLNSAGLRVNGVGSFGSTVTGSNLSGTNTGDQTIILTGDVTGSGVGSFAATIGANKVTFSKLVAATAAGVIGAAAAGNFSQLGLANGLAVIGGNLTIGASTPTSVASSGTVTGSNLSGTNTGDQTIILTGDVTGSGVGSFAATIAAGAVTPAKMANVASATVFYRKTAGVGAPEVQTLATLKADLGLAGTNSGDQWLGTDSLTPTFPNLTAPTTPAADNIAFAPQRLLASSGRVLPRWLDESGTFYTPQIHLARNDIFILVGHANQVAVDYMGYTPVTLGTMTARAIATTNRATRTRRTSWVSAATAGSMAGQHQGNHSNTTGSGTANDGSGFMFIARFVIADTVAGAHMFIGMGAQTPAAATYPSTIPNCIGIAQVNGSANLKLVYGGSAAQAAIDLGANFPANTNQTDVYELILYSPANVNGEVSVRLERVGTGNVYTNKIVADTPGLQLPLSTTLLGFKLYRSNNATAAAVTLDIAAIYTEANL